MNVNRLIATLVSVLTLPRVVVEVTSVSNGGGATSTERTAGSKTVSVAELPLPERMTNTAELVPVGSNRSNNLADLELVPPVLRALSMSLVAILTLVTPVPVWATPDNEILTARSAFVLD